MHISVISVHQLALLSRFPVNWRGMYSMVFAAFFATGVGCPRSAPLEAVAYWPQAPITPGWVNPEVLWQGGWGSWLGCR